MAPELPSGRRRTPVSSTRDERLVIERGLVTYRHARRARTAQPRQGALRLLKVAVTMTSARRFGVKAMRASAQVSCEAQLQLTRWRIGPSAGRWSLFQLLTTWRLLNCRSRCRVLVSLRRACPR